MLANKTLLVTGGTGSVGAEPVVAPCASTVPLSVNDAAAEPVDYMIDRYVVGGFYRVHTAKGADEVLNAPGMQFVPLAFDDCCTTPDHTAQPGAAPNRFYSYGVVARLALLAAAVELERTESAAA